MDVSEISNRKKPISAVTSWWYRFGSSIGILLIVGFVVAVPIREVAADFQLYLRLQNELLSKTPQGQRYTSLFYNHQDEIVRLMQADPSLLREGFSVLNIWQPNIQALLDNQGSKTTIKESQLQAVLLFLDHLSAVAGPELRQVIADERARTPLETLSGQTMDHAYELVVFRSSTGTDRVAKVTWYSPALNQAPQQWKIGVMIPIEFDLLDSFGQPIMDQSTVLTIVDGQGRSVFGPIGIGQDPARSLVVRGTRYRYDFRTAALTPGNYGFLVTAQSMGSGGSFGCGLTLSETK